MDLLNLWLGIVGEFAFGMTCGLAISLSQRNLTVDNVKKKKKFLIIVNCCCICKSSRDLVHISSLPLLTSFSVWVCLDVIVMI